MRIAASCFVVVLFCLSFTPPASAQTTLPSNLRVSEIYRELVESISDRSPTFQAQLRRLEAEPDLMVYLDIVPRILGARARTRLARREGALVAWIEVARFDDVVELIAHELEHVIERIEGVDFAAGVRASDSGIYAVSTNGTTFETTRAARAGVRVAAEVREAGRRGI